MKKGDWLYTTCDRTEDVTFGKRYQLVADNNCGDVCFNDDADFPRIRSERHYKVDKNYGETPFFESAAKTREMAEYSMKESIRKAIREARDSGKYSVVVENTTEDIRSELTEAGYGIYNVGTSYMIRWT